LAFTFDPIAFTDGLFGSIFSVGGNTVYLHTILDLSLAFN